MTVMDYLQRRHAIDVLLHVRDHPGISMTDLMRDLAPQSGKTHYARMTEAIALGLVHKDIGGRQWNASSLTLTPLGQEVAVHLEAIRRILGKTLSDSSKEV